MNKLPVENRCQKVNAYIKFPVALIMWDVIFAKNQINTIFKTIKSKYIIRLQIKMNIFPPKGIVEQD
jgi:hypothetical protein